MNTVSSGIGIIIPKNKESKTENANKADNDDVAVTTVKTTTTTTSAAIGVTATQDTSGARLDISTSGIVGVGNVGNEDSKKSKSRAASMTPLGATNSVDARIEFLENNDIVFRSIFENTAKYFNEKETKTAQKELSDIWVILKEGIHDTTLNGLLTRLAVILFVNEENLVKLSFVENSSDVEGISQIKHTLDESLFSQMVLKIGCFMDIYNDMTKKSTRKSTNTGDVNDNSGDSKTDEAAAQEDVKDVKKDDEASNDELKDETKENEMEKETSAIPIIDTTAASQSWLSNKKKKKKRELSFQEQLFEYFLRLSNESNVKPNIQTFFSIIFVQIGLYWQLRKNVLESDSSTKVKLVEDVEKYTKMEMIDLSCNGITSMCI